ncbi:MAG: PAS domain-containing protein [Nitrospirae bacterium]|nr:PAS domain-containing protein [Nitrospirota bacterium]
MDLFSFPLIDSKTGELKGVIEYVRDITERKKAEEENRFLASIIHTMPDTVCSIDMNGNIASWNQGGEKMLGYKAAEIIGKSIETIIPEEIAQKELEHCLTALQRDGSFSGYESVRITKDRRVMPVEITAVALRDKENRITAYASVMRDITDRKKSEKFIKDILETVDEGFIVIDGGYRIISANRAYLNLVHMSFEQVTGKYCYEIFHGTHEPCFEHGEPCPVLDVFKTGKHSAATHIHYDQNNNPIYVEIKAYPVWDDSGKVVSAIEVVNDVTDKKRLEAQLLHAQKLEAVGRLAGGVAHDFNNVLTAIIGYGSILKMKMEKDEPLLTYVDHILSATEKAASLTRNLLALSRKQKMATAPVDLNDIIRKVEKLLVRVIGEDIDIRTSLLNRELLVMADSGQIEQVLMNLATNARDAMQKGGTLTISTGIKRFEKAFMRLHGEGEVADYAFIAFSDTGTGMTEETKEKIFEPFFTTKEIGKGTGLGLSIVYGIIEQHNGYVDCYSEIGKGSTFNIYIPLTRLYSEKVKSEESRPIIGGTETILVAEDSATTRNSIKNLLEEFGYKIIEAIDGEDAVNKFMANKDKISLLLLDVVMPKMNGRDVYEKIKDLAPNAKALFISGYPSEVTAMGGLLSDGIKIISKPVLPKELLKEIRDILNRV